MELELVLCCLTILELLIKQYMEGNINYSTFNQHTKLKIEYLNQNMDTLTGGVKSNACRLIEKCNQILMQQSAHSA